MATHKVIFYTDAPVEEVREALVNVKGLGYFSLEELKKDKVKQPKMSDAKQLAMIYGSVFFAGLAVLMFIEWGTRP